MAKLISPYFSQIKGSIGNTTFYDTPVNPICGRSRIKPYNPNSPNQLVSRLSFLSAVGNWSLLSSTQRVEYSNLARDLHSAFPALVRTANGRSLFLRFYSIQELFYRRGITGYNGSLRIDADYCSETPLMSAEFSPLITPGTGFILTFYNFHTSALTCIWEFSPPQPLVSNFFSEGFDWGLTQSSPVDAAAGPGYPGTLVVHCPWMVALSAYFIRCRLFPPLADPRNWSSLPLVIRAETNTV